MQPVDKFSGSMYDVFRKAKASLSNPLPDAFALFLFSEGLPFSSLHRLPDHPNINQRALRKTLYETICLLVLPDGKACGSQAGGIPMKRNVFYSRAQAARRFVL